LTSGSTRNSGADEVSEGGAMFNPKIEDAEDVEDGDVDEDGANDVANEKEVEKVN